MNNHKHSRRTMEDSISEMNEILRPKILKSEKPSMHDIKILLEEAPEPIEHLDIPEAWTYKWAFPPHRYKRSK